MKERNIVWLAVSIIMILAITLVSGCAPAAPAGSAPTVSATGPVNFDTGVALDGAVTATFSKAMDPATLNTGTFTLKQGSTAISGTVSYSGNKATFKPAGNLVPCTVYTAMITTGAKDTGGIGLAVDKVWTFTSACGTASGSASASAFGGGSTASTGGSTGGSGAGAGSGVAVAGIAPTGGIPIGGSAPRVSTTNPINAGIGAGTCTAITATFNVPMDRLSINNTTFLLRHGIVNVPGTVTYAGGIASFQPTVCLDACTVYTATITTGARDTNGNRLAANRVWTFTTNCGLASTILGPVLCPTSVLANTAITNAGATTMNGDLDIHAGSSVDGGILVNPPGVRHITDAVALQAQTDLSAAIVYLNGLPTTVTFPAVPVIGSGGMAGYAVLPPGVYASPSSLGVTGNLILDAGGNGNALFVFKIPTTLTTAVASQIILANGAQANNVYWNVGAAATLNGGTIFNGSILAGTTITMNALTTMNGRALASTAAVNLNANSITTNCH